VTHPSLEADLLYLACMEEQPPSGKIVHYYSSFCLFSTHESELLYNYKFFIENIIMKLGEDWRIEANLLSQEIVALRSTEDATKDHSNFNLFN